MHRVYHDHVYVYLFHVFIYTVERPYLASLGSWGTRKWRANMVNLHIRNRVCIGVCRKLPNKTLKAYSPLTNCLQLTFRHI